MLGRQVYLMEKFDPNKSRNWKNILNNVKEEMPYAVN